MQVCKTLSPVPGRAHTLGKGWAVGTIGVTIINIIRGRMDNPTEDREHVTARQGRVVGPRARDPAATSQQPPLGPCPRAK